MQSDLSRVRAGVIFDNSGFRPAWFGMGNRKVVVKEVCYRWIEKKTGETIFKFTVSDGEQYYELHLNNTYMQWHLVI